MISQESTTKDVKLVGYDFRGHTRGTLVVWIPYYKGSAIFSLVFLSTTSEKSFIPYKASAVVQALKFCPVRPRVLCPVRPRVLSSWWIPSLRAAVDAWKSACSPQNYSHYHPTNSTHFQKSTKKKLGSNFVREAEGCRWELKARNSAVQLCASYDSRVVWYCLLDELYFAYLP